MQAEASAQVSLGCIRNRLYSRNHLMKRHAFWEPVIEAVIPTTWKSALLSLCVLVASISAVGPSLVAQTGNVVVSTNTTWATGTYSLTSLSVVNGATLTIGGGSSVTVSGAVVVTANSNIVLQSTNNSAQVNGAWQGAGVTVNAGSVEVDSGSSINADGQGYVASAGPGGAPAGSSAGGSYGGLGGVGAGGTPAAPIYGSNTMPTDLGSGGGSRCCGAIAGPGGGAIRLIVSGTLTDNGVISANGANLVGYQGGGGSGGSVWVTTAALAGSGVFTVNGGTGGEAAGGGGRIAVYYNAPASSFTGFAASTSTGGSCGSQCSNGASSAGANGTTGFFDTSATNSNLMVDQDLTIPAGTTVTYNSITVQPGAVLTIGGGSTITVTNTLTVGGTVVAQSINNSVQVSGSWQGSGVTLHASSVVVNAGGSINADGQGYVAGAGPGGSPSGSSAGGSYGGLGGVGNGVSPAGTYGSTTAPTDLGSGGNTRCCGTIPGAGGGALTITVSGTLTDNGIISANGGNGSGLQVGGGSGGTVSIQTGTLTGSGSVAANGGSGGEAGGGGGRIAVYYNTNSGFNTTLITSNGGAASSGNPGAVGTVYTLGAGSNLTVSNNTTLPANANLSFNSVTVNNAATLTLGIGTTFASNTVTVTGGGNVTVGGGSTLNVSGAVLVTGNSTMVFQSINNNAQVNGAWQGAGVTLNAGSVQVDQGSSINADGQGYVANAGPGGAPVGSSAGGSYGGLGGVGAGTAAGPTYGSDTTPIDLGSGGGSRCCGAIPGPGGGAVRLTVSGTLTNNGVISANGGNLVGYQGGGGSGGSVWVTTAALMGSGVFTANGGTGGEGAGGGGRVAVYYNAPGSNFTGFQTSVSNGGSCGSQCSNGTSSAGSVGTAAFFDTSAANNNLMLYQYLTIPASTTVSYNSITVQPGAFLTVGGGSTVTVANALTVSGTVIAQSINNTAQVGGSWQGSGVTFQAGSVAVNTGGSINADGQGYVASAGPGGAPIGSSAGGSYGGLGGVGAGTPAAAIYGSNTMPTDLGSGGGSRCCGAIAGPGGGAIRMIVNGTLTDNGVISANGANLIGYQGGGGSGGSLWVTTAGLAGSGVFTANGGTGGEAAGGGGRIAVYYNAPASSFAGFEASTSTGGSCGGQCSNGTSSAGGNGTAAFFDTSATNANLMVDQDLTIPARSSVTYNSITVQPGAVLTIGGGSTVTVANLLTVGGTVVVQSINNSALMNGMWQGTGATINAASVVVNTGGSINADSQGYVANAGPGGSPGGSSAGASYGGLGGVGDGASPAATYGSTTNPTDLGSGGGSRCCGTIPGAGGGALFLNVSGMLTDNGVISANGGNGSGLQVGGGSGGTVSIQAATVTGSGSITATGGSGGEAGGGGGRIALYYNTNSGLNLTMVTSNGGAASSGNAGATGTVYALGAGSTLTVSNNTALPANANLSYGSITVNNLGTLTLGSGTTLASNSVTVSGGGTVTVGGGSMLSVSGAVLVTGNSNIVLQAIDNTAQVNGVWTGVGVTLNAGSVQVDSGSSINADGQGYVANAGPGGAPSGSSAGGSYGGLGGVGDGTPAAPIYGSNTMPTDLGSGGGSRCCGSVPGAGGGAVRIIVSGTLTDNGIISANGANIVGYQAGAGAGGSVWVTTAGLAGSGVFTANGGTGGEAAGGGGRIAVYYNAPTSTFTGFQTSTSNGGSCGGQCSNGTSSAGSVGTVGFFDISAASDNLMVDQDLTIPAGTTVTYNSITVQPGAVLTIGGGSTVTVANTLTVSGTVIAQSVDNSALVNNTWQGAGVVINAASVVVNTNGSINADGQGYVANAGPGGAPGGSSTGGSYGGPGGFGSGASTSPAVYGSTTAPTDLGSGGSSRCCGAIAGAGGGALTFSVSGTFTNNGIVSANGEAVVGYQAGAGSGGSVYVRTAGLAGSGAFTANGGVGGEAGGGGGRVAIYYDAPSSDFTGFAASTATGGGCGANGNSSCANALSGGGNGTAAFFDTSATNNNLSIYQNFTIAAGTSPTYNAITVQTGALLTIGGAATVTITNALTVSGTVVAQSANNTAQVNGVWVGSGVAIDAGSIAVNASGSLNADTQGYVAGAGPGGSPSGSSAGGSYGGLGGVGNGVAPAGTYGSKTAPVDLGSGGNSRCCGTIPGAGGGALLLTVLGTLTDNGVISANGGDGSGLQVSGGAGGSVSIHTGILAGSGSIAANGGAGGEAGGGGGRVALYFNANNGLTLTLATADGGSSSNGNAGAVGTVYIPTPVAGSTTMLTASPTQVSPGQTVTFQAVVSTGTAGLTPTGTVTFLDGTTIIGTQLLSASQQSGTATAQFQTAALAVGTHSITASYSGDANTMPSVSPAQSVTVRLTATTSTLGLSAAAITVGQTETLTVTIAGGTGSPALGGTVNFFDTTAGTGLGAVTVTPTGTGGTAVLAVSNLAVGTHVLNAVYSGDSNYQASTAPNRTVVVSGKSQTITFPAIPNHAVTDAPFTLGATASSGLPVAYSVTSGPATVSGSTVTLTGTGTVVIQASQAGNSTYAAATPVSQSFTVSTAVQTITFPAIPNHTFGDAPFTLGATASSNLAVTYAVTSGPATVAGNTVTLTGAGSVTIQASQAGNATYAAATPVSQSFTVAQASQTITFPAIPNHTVADAPFALNATASSGLAVSYAVASGPATVSGNTVTLTGAGTVVIQATQAGNANYAAATPVSQSFTVSLATQTITFPAIPGHVFGDAPFTLSATASSGLPVSFTVTSGPATVLGNTVTLTGGGTVVIQATQVGNTTYAAATPVSQSFVVLPGGPTLVSITPASGVQNAGATSITLTGSNFASTDIVELNGAALASTYVNATTITAIVPASFFTTAGTGQVRVVDANGRTTAGQTFTVIMAPAITFSGPATTTSAAQPTLTFQLVNPYPQTISGTLTLTFTASGTNGVDDPAVQFSSGGRTMTFTIPALSTVTPTVQIQTGTVAGTATISLVVTSNGVNVTPANVTPVQITIAPAPPTITTSAITRYSGILNVSVNGFSNTRELSMAIFHFTAVPGSTISTPDITAPVGTVFGNYFSSTASAGYGSTFVYTQTFNLNGNDASSIQSVTVTLVNSQGDSMVATAQ
jgi:hypothetical protein